MYIKFHCLFSRCWCLHLGYASFVSSLIVFLVDCCLFCSYSVLANMVLNSYHSISYHVCRCWNLYERKFARVCTVFITPDTTPAWAVCHFEHALQKSATAWCVFGDDKTKSSLPICTCKPKRSKQCKLIGTAALTSLSHYLWSVV